MSVIDNARQDMADALEVCVRRCAESRDFVTELNRLTGQNFPFDGEDGLRVFTDFVGRNVLLPLVSQWLGEA
jgi:hypothetical protein